MLLIIIQIYLVISNQEANLLTIKHMTEHICLWV